MIINNNPHNPAGTLWTKEDFDNLTALTRKFPQLLVLSDEVYEYITFEQEFISAKQKEELRERLIAVSSFGKTFHITGWKIGYLTAPKNLMIEIKKVHQFLVFSVNHISQNAIAEYAKIADFNEIARLYQRKRDLFANEMKSSRFKLFPCEGSFFQLASYKGISEERDTEFVKTLVKKCGVATIPVSVFNANGKDQKVIRFCFAKDDKTLINASKQLCQI
jgi:methionine aminotransferase